MEKIQSVVLGGGCFWCLEAIYKRIPGVIRVTSGYAGGHVENPTYEQVCEKNTGHAEVVRVDFDPFERKLEEILHVFWNSHDPTTPDRQGNDVGPQYRSILFYRNQEEKEIMVASREKAQKGYSRPIVTEIVPEKKFYPAEKVHHDFYDRNLNHPYCLMVIAPKISKVGLNPSGIGSGIQEK